MGGQDAEGDELASLGGSPGVVDGQAIAVINFDFVVRGQDVQYSILAEALGRMRCRRGNRQSRVSRHGLEQEAGQGNVDFGRLFGHYEAIFGIGDDNWRSVMLRIAHAQQGLLKEACRPHQRQELFWAGSPRHWPQPGALAAGQNDWN